MFIWQISEAYYLAFRTAFTLPFLSRCRSHFLMIRAPLLRTRMVQTSHCGNTHKKPSSSSCRETSQSSILVRMIYIDCTKDIVLSEDLGGAFQRFRIYSISLTGYYAIPGFCLFKTREILMAPLCKV